jgi:hypothetical protein
MRFWTLRLGSSLQVAALAAVLALSAGCGDNDNEVINIGVTPTVTPGGGPTRTATPGAANPTPTVTPGGGGGATRVVTLTAESSAPLQGFTIRVEYPTAKGSFAGSADSVECSSTVPGFTPNDLDNGTMLLVAGSPSALPFPVTITCNFDETAGQALAAGDLNLVVQSVTEGGAAGDPADLSVSAGVS